jgi:hypothetical protein
MVLALDQPELGCRRVYRFGAFLVAHTYSDAALGLVTSAITQPPASLDILSSAA